MTNKYFMLYSNFFTMKMILLTNLQCKSNNSYHRTVCSEKGKNSESYLASAHGKQARSAFETKQTKFTGLLPEIYRFNCFLKIFAIGAKTLLYPLGGTKLCGLFVREFPFPGAPHSLLLALEQVLLCGKLP